MLIKRELLGSVRGTVLEIGAGRGANLPLLPKGVRWIGLEPDAGRRAALARAAARFGHRDPVLAATAERVPLASGSVSAVVATIVLCSVADPAAALAEVRRVLAPGGRFLFVEHVGAPAGSWRRRAQGWAAPLTRRFDHGCDPTRDTAAAIRAAGFAAVDLRSYDRPLSVLYHDLVAGVATA